MNEEPIVCEFCDNDWPESEMDSCAECFIDVCPACVGKGNLCPDCKDDEKEN